MTLGLCTSVLTLAAAKIGFEKQTGYLQPYSAQTVRDRARLVGSDGTTNPTMDDVDQYCHYNKTAFSRAIRDEDCAHVVTTISRGGAAGHAYRTRY